MKTRNGFVSNSSSSSFVLVGFIGFIVDKSQEEQLYNCFTQEQKEFAAKTTGYKKWEDIEEHYDKVYALQNTTGIMIADTTENGAPEGKILIGIEHSFGECNENTATFHYKDIEQTLKPIAQNLNLNFPEDLVIICDIKNT